MWSEAFLVIGIAFLAAGALGLLLSWIQSRKKTPPADASGNIVAVAPVPVPNTGGGISIYVRVAILLGLAIVGAYLAFYNPVDKTPVQAGNEYGDCHVGLSVPRQVPTDSEIPVDLYSNCIDPLRTAQLFANGVPQSPPAITRYFQSAKAEDVPAAQTTTAPLRSWTPSANDSAVRWYVKSSKTTAIDVLLVPRASQQLLHSGMVKVFNEKSVPGGAAVSEPFAGGMQLAGYKSALTYPKAAQKDSVYTVQVSATCTRKCKSFPDLTLYVNGATPAPDYAQVPLQIDNHPGVEWFVKAGGMSQRLDLIGSLPTSTLIKVENEEHTPITVTSALSGVSDTIGEIGRFVAGIGTGLVGILFFLRTGKQQQPGGTP